MGAIDQRHGDSNKVSEAFSPVELAGLQGFERYRTRTQVSGDGETQTYFDELRLNPPSMLIPRYSRSASASMRGRSKSSLRPKLENNWNNWGQTEPTRALWTPLKVDWTSPINATNVHIGRRGV